MATEKQKLQNEEFMRQMAELTDKFNREMNVLVQNDNLAGDKAVANAIPSRVARKPRKANVTKQPSGRTNRVIDARDSLWSSLDNLTVGMSAKERSQYLMKLVEQVTQKS